MKEEKEFKYNIYDIIKVKSNLPLFPDYLKTDKKIKPDLEFREGKIKFEKEKYGEYDLTETLGEKFYGGKNNLYLEQKIKGILLSRCILNNLEEKTKFVYEKKTLRKVLPNLPSSIFKIEGLKSPIMQIKLLQKNHMIIHAGVVTKNEKAYVLPSWSNVGKSTTTHLLSEKGFNVLSDSIPIISKNGKIYSTESEGEYYNKRGKKINFKYDSKKANIKKIFLLKKAKPSFIKKTDKEKIINKIITSTQKGIESVLSRKVLLAYYFLNDYYIDEYQKMYKILEKALKDTECFIVGGNRSNFYKTIVSL